MSDGQCTECGDANHKWSDCPQRATKILMNAMEVKRRDQQQQEVQNNLLATLLAGKTKPKLIKPKKEVNLIDMDSDDSEN